MNEELEFKIKRLSKEKLRKLLDILDFKLVTVSSDDGETNFNEDINVDEIIYDLGEKFSDDEIIKALDMVDEK